MDLNKTGGPAYPTLSGGLVDDKTFRWEGMTLFDYYLGIFLSMGLTPQEAFDEVAFVLAERADYFKPNEPNE
jgi:hypothetical protein